MRTLRPRRASVSLAVVHERFAAASNLNRFPLTLARRFATLAENFNVSVPYTQMLSVRVRDSKFGQALVVEASPRAGGYLLGRWRCCSLTFQSDHWVCCA